MNVIPLSPSVLVGHACWGLSRHLLLFFRDFLCLLTWLLSLYVLKSLRAVQWCMLINPGYWRQKQEECGVPASFGNLAILYLSKQIQIINT